MKLQQTKENKEKEHNIVSQWYKKYYNLLARRAYDMLQDRELAKDMIQNTFIRVINNFETLVNMSDVAIAVYLIETNRSVCIDYMRKNKIELVFSENMNYADLSRESVFGLKGYDYINFVMDFEQSMYKLKERDRILIVGKYVYGLSDKELGKLVNLKTNSVRSATKRALDNLREISGEEV